MSDCTLEAGRGQKPLWIPRLAEMMDCIQSQLKEWKIQAKVQAGLLWINKKNIPAQISSWSISKLLRGKKKKPWNTTTKPEVLGEMCILNSISREDFPHHLTEELYSR